MFSKILLFFIILISYLSVVYNAMLRGVMLESHPFIIKDGNQYKGYIIDVLNAMTNISDFNYYLYEEQELGTVDIKHGNISGLLGEVRTNSADFGVSNIEVTEERKRYVDFTDPILNYSVSALISKKNIGNITSFQVLADQTRVAYGSLLNSSIMQLFENTNDIMLNRMYALMRSKGVSVTNLEMALKKVKTSNYAFIGNSMTVQLMAKQSCDFTIITDNRQYFQRHISIALPKGSKFLEVFNQFLKQLKSKGKMDEIYNRYFQSGCAHNSSDSLILKTFHILVIVLIFPFVLKFVY